MSRILISFLGTNDYLETHYDFYEESSSPVRFIQEALVRLICKNWDEADKICIFCTSGQAGSKKKNWDDNGHLDKNGEKLPRKGLGHILKDMQDNNLLKAELVCQIIPEGFDSTQIWEIFEKVYSEIREGDHIFFDVTHAFRSIPIFATVLLNYSRSMKQTVIEGIYYGAFEKLGSASIVSNIPISDRHAPIIDMTDIVRLQDTITNANNFRDFGKFGAINTIHEKNGTEKRRVYEAVIRLRKALIRLDDDIAVCNMEDIRTGKFVNDVSTSYNIVKNSESTFTKASKKLLEEICTHIKEQFSTGNSDKNIDSAIRWALEHNMIQQAYTLAQEHIISLVTDKLNDFNPYQDAKLKDKEKKFRMFISAILGARAPQNGIAAPQRNEYKEPLSSYPDVSERLLNNKDILTIRKHYISLAEKRNMINHAKQRNATITKEWLAKELATRYNTIKEAMNSLKLDLK